MSVMMSNIIKKRVSELSQSDFTQWYQLLCQTEVSYQREFFDNLVQLTNFAYFCYNDLGRLVSACAVSYIETHLDSKPIVIIKTNLVCIDSHYRGGSFIRKAGWLSMRFAKNKYGNVPLFWASVLLSPVAYFLIAKTFKEYYPHPDNVTPDIIESMMQYVSNGHFKLNYTNTLFDGEGKQSINPFQINSNSNEQTIKLFKYFISINPNYINGSAFVCIIPLNYKNKLSLLVKGFKKTTYKQVVAGA